MARQQRLNKHTACLPAHDPYPLPLLPSLFSFLISPLSLSLILHSYATLLTPLLIPSLTIVRL